VRGLFATPSGVPSVAGAIAVVNTSGMRLSVLVFFAWSLALACTDAPAEEVEGSQGAQVAPTAGEEGAPAEAPTDTEAERRAKLAHREPGSTEEAEIDWSDAATHPRADVSTLSAEARAAIAGVTLPVLLPRDAALLAGAVITRGPTWYAASLHPSGHHVSIHGTKLEVHHPALVDSIPEERRPRPGQTTLSRTHGIVSVAFQAFGASYTLDVECDAPESDVRCTEDAYALALVEGLGVAGGAPR
jgi:hypothetical protein